MRFWCSIFVSGNLKKIWHTKLNKKKLSCRDGTTDVTRTWKFGTPTDYEKECFTRVLKGQMSLGNAKFPKKIKGKHLDTIARKALWDAGMDYGHGTGHGIGHFLNVHEGPMGIGSKFLNFII